jgi:hypothetical protein
MRLSGWSVAVAGLAPDHAAPRLVPTPALRWIVVACPPESLGSDAVARLETLLREMPVVVVCRVPPKGSALASLAGAWAGSDEHASRAVRWQGPGAQRSWQLRGRLCARRLTVEADVVPWAQGDAEAVIVARRVGKGWVVTLGFHPSQARDDDGALARSRADPRPPDG